VHRENDANDPKPTYGGYRPTSAFGGKAGIEAREGQINCTAPGRHRIPPLGMPRFRMEADATHLDKISSRKSRIDPDRHARLESCRVTLQVEAQAQSIAVVTANRALGLPGCERAQRAHFGDQSECFLRGA
jgi:hypothetical protein